MACPQCKGIEEVFDGREARKDLRKYRKKGPSRTTRMLIDAVSEGGVEGPYAARRRRRYRGHPARAAADRHVCRLRCRRLVGIHRGGP